MSQENPTIKRDHDYGVLGNFEYAKDKAYYQRLLKHPLGTQAEKDGQVLKDYENIQKAAAWARKHGLTEVSDATIEAIEDAYTEKGLTAPFKNQAAKRPQTTNGKSN